MPVRFKSSSCRVSSTLSCVLVGSQILRQHRLSLGDTTCLFLNGNLFCKKRPSRETPCLLISESPKFRVFVPVEVHFAVRELDKLATLLHDKYLTASRSSLADHKGSSRWSNIAFNIQYHKPFQQGMTLYPEGASHEGSSYDSGQSSSIH